MSKIHHCSPPPKSQEMPQNQIKKRRTNNVNDYEGDEMSDKVDRISTLPNDILVYLLSFVEMKTAGITSLLSTRWRYVWTHLTDLIFEDEEFFLQRKMVSSEIEKFSKWVEQVMIAHRAPYLNTLRIHFPLYGPFGDNSIDKWVKFAVKKNVCNLELNLATFTGYRAADPKKIDYINPTIRHHHYYGTVLKSVHLKSLHLEALFFEGPALENVLSNCLNIERLTMRSCHFFSRVFSACSRRSTYKELEVLSLKLKHLEFSRCTFGSIKISAPQLTSFVLLAQYNADVEYTNVPSLVDVTFKASYCFQITHKLNVFSNFSYRLRKLSIYWDKVSYKSHRFPHLLNGNLLDLTSLIDACPLLHAFKLEVNHHKTKEGEAMSGDDARSNHAMRAHEHLMFVEFVGFDGSAAMVELAICVTQHAPMLKKIILDPQCSRLIGGFLPILTDKKNVDGLDFARRQARLLAERIRGGVDVMIL